MGGREIEVGSRQICGELEREVVVVVVVQHGRGAKFRAAFFYRGDRSARSLCCYLLPTHRQDVSSRENKRIFYNNDKFVNFLSSFFFSFPPFPQPPSSFSNMTIVTVQEQNNQGDSSKDFAIIK